MKTLYHDKLLLHEKIHIVINLMKPIKIHTCNVIVKCVKDSIEIQNNLQQLTKCQKRFCSLKSDILYIYIRTFLC